MHLHISLLVVLQKTPHTAQWKITMLTLILCLPLPDGTFFFLSIQKAHNFSRPDFFKVWKRNAVPMVKLLFLPVRLRDVNVPIRWRTKFRLKVSCRFPCAIEWGCFFRSYKMKQFTRHTFRTKCSIKIHLFFKIGQHQSTRVSDHLYLHLPYVSCNLWRLKDIQFLFLHCLFLFFLLPNHQSRDGNLWKGGEQHVCLATLPPSHLHAAFSWTRLFQFQDSWFLKFCWPIFSICPCSATAVRFLFQKHFH